VERSFVNIFGGGSKTCKNINHELLLGVNIGGILSSCLPVSETFEKVVALLLSHILKLAKVS
jgi:hypothetical protein